jgi:hypothetical protein
MADVIFACQKIIEGKKPVPVIGCFILPGIPSILLQITCIKTYLKAKMT